MKIKKKAKAKLRKEAIKSLTEHSYIISRFREIFGMFDESDKKVIKEIKKMIHSYLEDGLDERDDMEKFMDDVDDIRNNGTIKKKEKKNKFKENIEIDEDDDDILDFD